MFLSYNILNITLPLHKFQYTTCNDAKRIEQLQQSLEVQSPRNSPTVHRRTKNSPWIYNGFYESPPELAPPRSGKIRKCQFPQVYKGSISPPPWNRHRPAREFIECMISIGVSKVFRPCQILCSLCVFAKTWFY